MRLIWATRGRNWGFRFVDSGAFADPLPEYDKAFSGIGDQPAAWRRVGSLVALRFPDPAGRKDRAGRVIPHEFVVFPPLADRVNSVEDGLDLVWPLVKDRFDLSWNLPEPPAPHEGERERPPRTTLRDHNHE